MSDDVLRALERKVLADGGAEERLAYAAALDRAGRPDDATVVLRPVRDDPAVATVLSRRQAWTFECWGAPGTHAIDVRPLRSKPRRRWRLDLTPPGRIAQTDGAWLLASELGVVCAAGDRAHVQVLDAGTGAERWSTRLEQAGHRSVAHIVGARLLIVDPPRLRVLALGTGEPLGTIPLDGRDPASVAVQVVGERVFTWNDERFVAWDLAALGQPAWEAAPPANALFSLLQGDAVHVIDGLVLVRLAGDEHRTVALDVESGAELGVRPGAVLAVDPDGVALRTSTGLALASGPGSRTQVPVTGSDDFLGALAPTFAVTLERRDEGRAAQTYRVIARSRRSGEVIGLLTDYVYDFGGIAVARDVAYSFFWMLDPETVESLDRRGGVQTRLCAQTADGAVLWALSEEELGIASPTGALALAPLTDRLYVLGQDGAVSCFELDRPAEAR